jgi:hypothetical protein
MQEISDYYTARKRLTLITNTKRLINIIKVYFETLIFYLENSPNKFHVKIKQKLYEAKINGHTETGQHVSLDLEDISGQLVENVICDLAKTINPGIFAEVVQLLNAIILTPKIASRHKISILNGENKLPQGSWYTLLRQLPEKLAIETIYIRKYFIFQIIKSPENHSPDSKNITENISTLHRAFELYLKTLLRIHIYHNHYDETNLAIINNLEELIDQPNNNYLDKKRLVEFMLTQLVLNNNLFQIERKDRLRETIEEYSEYIESGTLSRIYEDVDFNPENFEIGKLCVDMLEPDFSGENLTEIKEMAGRS